MGVYWNCLHQEGGQTMGMKAPSRCPACKSTHIEYKGTDEKGQQNWQCKECGNKFVYKAA